MFLRKLTIAYRSLVCFSLMSLVILILGAVCLRQIDKIRQDALLIERDALPSVAEADTLSMSMMRLRAEAIRLLAITDLQQQRVTLAKIDGLALETNTQFDSYESLITSEEEVSAIRALRVTFNEYMHGHRRVSDLLTRQQREEALRVINNEQAQLGRQLNSLAGELALINRNAANAAGERAAMHYRQTRWSVMVAVVLALLLTVLLAWRMTRSLTTPLQEAMHLAGCIAAGDLSQARVVAGRDEPAELLNALASMQFELKDTVAQIAQAALQLKSHASTTSEKNLVSSSDLRLQHSELEAAVTSVAEMSRSVEEVAETAHSVSSFSEAATARARGGRQLISQTVSAIENLSGGVTTASRQAEHLADQTRDIRQVLEVIRNVAEQTNLLALNAAIEAARAGEAGRGFAVVADEVRGLAHRTGASTQEIEALIGRIQADTQQTMDCLSESVIQAHATLLSAQVAGDAFQALASEIEGLNEQNLVIASTAEEQAAVAREVDSNLMRIRQLSLKTDASAQASVAESNDLLALAEQLNALCRRFTL